VAGTGRITLHRAGGRYR